MFLSPHSFVLATIGTFLFGTVAIAPSGCGSTSNATLGSESTIERSGERPEWLSRIPDDDDYVYFRGMRTGAKRLDDGLTDARQHAARQVAESILTNANIDYQRSRIENAQIAYISADVPALVKDGLIMLAKASQQGVRERESYWEKVEKVGRHGVAYSYNVYTLIQLSQVDYRANAMRIFGEQLQKAVEVHDKAAEEHLQGMLDRISGEEGQ